MKNEIKLAAAAGAVIVLALAPIACSSADGGEGDTEMSNQESGMTTLPLEGPTWVLTSYGDPADPTPVAAGKAVTATFDSLKSRIGGNATCNRYFARYKIDGKRIKVKEAGATKMACLSPELAKQEDAFLAAIAAAETFRIEGDTLRIRYGDGDVLTFTVQPSAALEGTDWVVTGYNNGKGGVVSVLTGTKLTARFFDGGLAGSAGCNSYRTEYTVNASSLDIGPAAVTRKLCARPEGIMEQEAQFLAALASAAVYRTDGDTLELRREEGALAVKLEARD